MSQRLGASYAPTPISRLQCCCSLLLLSIVASALPAFIWAEYDCFDLTPVGTPTAVLFAEYEPPASHPVKSAQAQSAAAIVAAMMIARALLPPRLDFSLCCIVRILQGPTIPSAMVDVEYTYLWRMSSNNLDAGV